MASLSITVDDTQVQQVLDAITWENAGRSFAPTTPATQADVRVWLKARLRQTVREYNLAKGQTQIVIPPDLT